MILYKLYGIIHFVMKKRDLDRENSEMLISLQDFLESYNKTIPGEFPHATTALLKEFRSTYNSLFKNKSLWSLNEHRKKVMDWLSQRTTLTRQQGNA